MCADGEHHGVLAGPAADLIGGSWSALASGRTGDASSIIATNPAEPDRIVWAGRSDISHVDAAVRSAREALQCWIAAGRERRFAVLRRFQSLCKAREAGMAELICDQVGKVMWEARQEALALSQKIDITLEDGAASPQSRVRDFDIPLGPGKSGRTVFRPHGVMAVIGPFNFPAHLPNGHIVPALAMGNTIVFKPSDKAPAVGQLLTEWLAEALELEGFGGGGGGVVNLVQGGVDVASALVTHEGIDGVLFTGSWPVGRRIMEANLDRPGRMLALEMGGNNAAVIMPDADLRQAVIECVRCAFNTAGQRCTCTRRLIVHRDIFDRVVRAVCNAASNLIVGHPRAGTVGGSGGGPSGKAGHPVFMGPMISESARQAVVNFQRDASKAGGKVLVPCTEMASPGNASGRHGWYLSSGVMAVERFVVDDGSRPIRDAGCDVEVFGPLLRVTAADSLDDAINQANATRYGLAASIFSRNPGTIDRFMAEVRAGCINVNTGTAGASSKLPFGGLGRSGNHRPAGAYSLDYCAFPVASMVESGGAATIAEGMRFEEDWLR